MTLQHDCCCACCDFDRKFAIAVANEDEIEIVVRADFYPEDSELPPIALSEYPNLLLEYNPWE